MFFVPANKTSYIRRWQTSNIHGLDLPRVINKAAGVEDFEALADFYADNPDEVPEPMDAGFFLKYKDEIVNAANDQYRYDSSDAGME